MLKRFGLALIALLLFLSPALAASPFDTAAPQKIVGLVVSSCGSQSLTVGNYSQVTMDTTGHLCGSGGGGAITIGTTPISGGAVGDCLQVASGPVVGAASCGTASSVTVGTTAINGGTSGNIEYNNAGVFGEKAVTGTGSVVLAANPTLAGATISSGDTIGFTVSSSGAAYSVNCFFKGGTECAYSTAPGNAQFVGLQSGPTNLATYTGTDNTGLGGDEFNDCTSCNFNIMIGNETGLTLSTGTYNTCVGFEACHDITTASYVVAIGQTEAAAVTASNVIVIGGSSDCHLGCGPGDISIGGQLSSSAGTGNNIVMGGSSGQTITTGGYNLFFGNNAGYGVTTGSGNIYVGGYMAPALSAAAAHTFTLNSGDSTVHMADYNITVASGWYFNGNAELNGQIELAGAATSQSAGTTALGSGTTNPSAGNCPAGAHICMNVYVGSYAGVVPVY